jgi:hypothetical protein
MSVIKSRDVAGLLGIPYYRLYHLLAAGHIAAPGKDSSGDFIWQPDDVERARQALARLRRPRREEAAHAP